jgi:hypothetical protein
MRIDNLSNIDSNFETFFLLTPILNNDIFGMTYSDAESISLPERSVYTRPVSMKAQANAL